jgi:hypothetical protein
VAGADHDEVIFFGIKSHGCGFFDELLKIEKMAGTEARPTVTKYILVGRPALAAASYLLTKSHVKKFRLELMARDDYANFPRIQRAEKETPIR